MAGVLGRVARTSVPRLTGLGEGLGARPGPAQIEGARHASLQTVKQRMRSVANIMKITKAMKMVAAARMRGAQTRVEKSRGMREAVFRMVGDSPAAEGVEKVVTVPVSSDRGLCGGINSAVNKYVKTLNELNEGESSSMVVVGEKSRSGLQNTLGTQFSHSFVDGTKSAGGFSLASTICEDILQQEHDAVRVVYNRFKSAISFEPTLATSLAPATLETSGFSQESDKYEVEGPDRSELLTDLSEFSLAVTFHNGFLENSCSEQASRVQAMENSSKNASEMLEKLTLMYNRTRQAAITTELIEIISGAAALEG
eukprot:CAMPEP_0119131060 /NCGR_PEP_ID=MMETSP1310-20130426/9350_1 /TAXON_ID=464262 /ORGANISM="Genus nov. species nov., Strain RCC2339" /LENGTH=311 /DNA_ID=CAMNT_0007121613 /DNA_START=14 /DNA_END=949 /DNA_ORIENTATION=-